MNRYILITSLFFVSLGAFAQNAQGEYLEAKRLFNNGQYATAKEAFNPLFDSEVFGRNSLFYYAMCAYRLQDFNTSKEILRQLLVQFPTWNQKSEVLYWLALSQFKSGEYTNGLSTAGQLTSLSKDEAIEGMMITKFVSPLKVEEVEALYTEEDDNKMLAAVLVEKMMAAPYESRDYDKIDQLVTKWNLDVKEMTSEDFPLVKKDVYDMAVVLPFLFEGLDNTTLITQNSLVMDMYQGMQMAAADLKSQNMPVKLNPYDTKRNAGTTTQILKNPTFAYNDVIIGPLFDQPNQLVREYAQTNEINHVNPISSSASVIGDNKFSFLMKPTYETMAMQMAEYAADHNENRNAMIFYEQSERDSLFAAAFKSKLESRGFKVLWFQPITKQNSHRLLDTLVAQYDRYLTQTQADSIRLMPGRFVKERKIKKDEMSRMERRGYLSLDANQNPIVYYENRFFMKPDSVGTILAATHSNLFANNLIGAVQARGDNIDLYGYGDWLGFTMLSYDQLDRLDVTLVDPDYLERSSPDYDALTQKFIEKYKTKPSIYHYRGYETVYYCGYMMHKYGKYFQRGMREGTYVPGKVLEGYLYGLANDNQVVPLIRFENAKLEVVNREYYED